jgi:hypothetical protein
VERGMELELGRRIGLRRIGNSSRKDYVVTGAIDATVTEGTSCSEALFFDDP